MSQRCSGNYLLSVLHLLVFWCFAVPLPSVMMLTLSTYPYPPFLFPVPHVISCHFKIVCMKTSFLNSFLNSERRTPLLSGFVVC